MSDVNTLYKEAHDLASQPEDRFLDFARAVERLHSQSVDLFRRLGAELGMGPRKLYYLVEVARGTKGLPVSDKRLVAIGWTRLAMIARHITPANWKGLLELAETNTARDLATILRGGDPGGNAHCVLLYMGARQYDMYRDAVLAHGARPTGRGLEGQERALMTILARLGAPGRRRPSRS